MDGKQFEVVLEGKKIKLYMSFVLCFNQNNLKIGDKICNAFSALAVDGEIYCCFRETYLVVIKNERTGKFVLYRQEKDNPIDFQNWKMVGTEVEEIKKT